MLYLSLSLCDCFSAYEYFICIHLYTVVCVKLKGQEKVQILLVLPSKVVVDELVSDSFS